MPFTQVFSLLHLIKACRSKAFFFSWDCHFTYRITIKWLATVPVNVFLIESFISRKVSYWYLKHSMKVFKTMNVFIMYFSLKYFEIPFCMLLFKKHRISYSLCKRFIGCTLMCLKWYVKDRVHPIISVWMPHNRDRIHFNSRSIHWANVSNKRYLLWEISEWTRCALFPQSAFHFMAETDIQKALWSLKQNWNSQTFFLARNKVLEDRTVFSFPSSFISLNFKIIHGIWYTCFL